MRSLTRSWGKEENGIRVLFCFSSGSLLNRPWKSLFFDSRLFLYDPLSFLWSKSHSPRRPWSGNGHPISSPVHCQFFVVLWHSLHSFIHKLFVNRFSQVMLNAELGFLLGHWYSLAPSSAPRSPVMKRGEWIRVYTWIVTSLMQLQRYRRIFCCVDPRDMSSLAPDPVRIFWLHVVENPS